MNLRTELVTSVAAQYPAAPAPRLVRVVKTPELASPFTAVALDNGAVGISYNLFHSDPAAVECYRAWNPADLAGQPALEVMDRFLADDLLQRTIGFAVLNALCQALFQRDPQVHGLDFSVRLLDLLDPSPADTVGLVGYFPPTVRHLLGRVAELVVVERSATLLANEYPFTMSSDPTSLSRCDKVLITATTILNDTLEGLLAHCSGASFVAVMGPSAGICPGPLFALGVDAVGGTFIRRPELFLERFARGEKWGDAKCKFVAQR